MRIDDVIGGKLAGYEMVEAKFNGTVVWPLNYTYLITAARVVYSAGSAIYAKGSYAWDGNYAYVLGTVNVYINGVLVNTLTDVRLTPTVEQGSWFSVDTSLNILGNNLGTIPSAQHNETVTVAYGNSSTTVTVSQQANVKTPTSYTPTGSKHYGLPTVTASDYQVDFSTNKYGSAASAAPASGATTTALQATLSVTASHIEVTTTPWTQDAYVVYTYTSGASSDGTIADYYSGTDTSSPVSVTDTPTISGSAAGFTRSGMYVTIASEGTTSYPSGRSVTYTASVSKMGGGTAQDTVTLYQALNKVEGTSSNTTRSWGNPYDTNTQSDYTASLSLNRYNTSSSPAPAGGGTATITITANHKNTKITHRPYTDTTVTTSTWSSGSTSTSTSTNSGEATDTPVVTTITDSPTPTSSQNWATISGSTLTIASRGTSPSSTYRYATISVTNGTASATELVYQAKNGSTTGYLYDLAISISLSTGTIPAGGGNYTVSARSYRITRTTYDSGAINDTSSKYTAQLAKQNCTSSKTTVYGDETFSIEVTPNSSTTDPRIVKLTLSAGGESVVAQAIQDAVPIPTNQVATFLPYIPTTGTNKGKVYYTFRVDSGSLTSATVTGLYFRYQRNGGSTQSVNIGSFNVAQTSSPVLLNVSGIPDFSSSRSVKAWFDITGSKGGFDNIKANESTYYTYVEFDPYVPPTPEPNT